MLYSFYDYDSPPDPKEFECVVCGVEMYKDKTYCSNNCFKADLL